MGLQQYAKIISNGVQAVQRKGNFVGASLSPAAAAASLIIHDGTDNTGPTVAHLVAAANGYTAVTPECDVPFTVGLFVEWAGAGAVGMVYWE